MEVWEKGVEEVGSEKKIAVGISIYAWEEVVVRAGETTSIR